MNMKHLFSKNISLKLSKKEAKYLSSLIETQISRYDMLGEEEIKKKKSHKEAYKVFNKIGRVLSA